MRTKLAVVLAVALVVGLSLYAVDRRRADVSATDAGRDAPLDLADANGQEGPSDGASPRDLDAALEAALDLDAGSAFAPLPACADEGCEGLRGDPWFLEARDFPRGDGACGMKESTREVRLRYVADAGEATHALATLEETCPSGSGVGFRWARTFDFDGDGVRELLVGVEHGGATGTTAETSSAWTYREGAIVPYEPPRADGGPLRRDAGAFALPNFADTDDVDHDGRPDLLTRGGYEESATVRAGGPKLVMLVPPLFVLHALPDGSFTTSDDVAKKHLAQACLGAGPLEDLFQRSRGDDFDRDGFDQELAKAVVCDRARGRSEAEVLGVLRTWCNSVSADLLASPDLENAPGGGKFVCADWTLALAKRTPVTSLR